MARISCSLLLVGYRLSLFSRQKQDQTHVSQKFIEQSLNTGNTHSHPIGDRRANSSSDTTLPIYKHDDVHSLSNIDEQVRRPLSKIDVRQATSTRTAATPLERALTTHPHKRSSESLQINDHDQDSYVPYRQVNYSTNDENNRSSTDDDYVMFEQLSRKESILPPIKLKETIEQDENAKSRKIRQLQTRLSRQEDETKKHLNELQLKQSRLENALKLLSTSSSSTSSKHHAMVNDDGSSRPNRCSRISSMMCRSRCR
jgi:hypothetical protein